MAVALRRLVFAARSILFFALPVLSSMGVAQANPAGANSQGFPGEWLPAIAHGPHLLGCLLNSGNGPPDPTQFYPIHGAMIPTGPFQGCVLVWEKGHQGACRTYTTTPNASIPSTFTADAEQRWAIFDPRTTPPTIHKFVWKILATDAPFPPCTAPNAPSTQIVGGHQGLFCSGHCWLPDGRLLVAGGDYWFMGICGPLVDFAGSRMLAVFNPNDVDPTQPVQSTNGPGFGRPWTCLNPASAGGLSLRTPRWYPSVTLMAPASLSQLNPYVYISIGGGVEKYEPSVAVPSTNDPSFSTHELFRFNVFTNVISRDPRIGTTPSPQAGLFQGPTTPSASGVSFLYYPRQHFMSARPASPDGRLWMAGMAIQSADADVINAPEGWNNSGSVLALGAGNTLIEEPTVVLFPAINPGYRDVQMVIGGMKTTPQHGGTGQITNEVFFMPSRANPATWVPGGLSLSMQRARKFANAVIMPDASIIVIGGGFDPNHGVPGNAVFEAEMFSNGSWELLSDQLSERTYHSIALLLSNGFILSAGGDSHEVNAEYEIFVPPCLQGSPALPSYIAAPPTTIHYGQQNSCVPFVPFGQSIAHVVLISPSSVTHSQDSNQRYEPMAFELDETGSLSFVAPANATLAPPGFYMMFMVSSAGVPSVAHWVQLLP